MWSEAGRPRIVVDAKYRAEKPSGFPQADLYQLLAYCTVLGLDVGHLIYAQAEEEARVHHVRGAEVRLVAHTLDLDAGPVQLLASMNSLADQLVVRAASTSPLRTVTV